MSNLILIPLSFPSISGLFGGKLLNFTWITVLPRCANYMGGVPCLSGPATFSGNCTLIREHGGAQPFPQLERDTGADEWWAGAPEKEKLLTRGAQPAPWAVLAMPKASRFGQTGGRDRSSVTM